MDRLKQQLQAKLIAGVLAEQLKQSENLIFREAWCTQERVLRFTTPLFRSIFGTGKDGAGRWKTGDCVMLETENKADGLTVRCVLHAPSVPADRRDQAAALCKACGKAFSAATESVTLRQWDIPLKNGDINALTKSFGELLEKGIPAFEKTAADALAAKTEEEPLCEGDGKSVTLNKYERNPKARAACLAYHGTACAVCGMDFGKVYGPAFAGKIEVHHVVPLSEIKENYVVDPIRDLIPVCPNCHTALHSKKDGVYTVDELKAIRAGIL